VAKQYDLIAACYYKIARAAPILLINIKLYIPSDLAAYPSEDAVIAGCYCRVIKAIIPY
jgi:hypothetical protein